MRKYGQYLKSLRQAKGLSLRDVERVTSVSNAYLSQLESERIKQPSPTVLHKLARFYDVPYDYLMECVGYPAAGSTSRESTKPTHSDRLGKLTGDEEIALLDYLAFIRRKKSKI